MMRKMPTVFEERRTRRASRVAYLAEGIYGISIGVQLVLCDLVSAIT